MEASIHVLLLLWNGGGRRCKVQPLAFGVHAGWEGGWDVDVGQKGEGRQLSSHCSVRARSILHGFSDRTLPTVCFNPRLGKACHVMRKPNI